MLTTGSGGRARAQPERSMFIERAYAPEACRCNYCEHEEASLSPPCIHQRDCQSIEEKAQQQAGRRRKQCMACRLIAPAAVAAGLGAFGWHNGLLSTELLPTEMPELPNLLKANCFIKGNISINTGQRIYHVPGQRLYAETQISPRRGERWFCSEAEARAAGWRRARN